MRAQEAVTSAVAIKLQLWIIPVSKYIYIDECCSQLIVHMRAKWRDLIRCKQISHLRSNIRTQMFIINYFFLIACMSAMLLYTNGCCVGTQPNLHKLYDIPDHSSLSHVCQTTPPFLLSPRPLLPLS